MGQYLLSLLIEHACIYIFIIFAILWQVNLLRMQVPFVFSYLLYMPLLSTLDME